MIPGTSRRQAATARPLLLALGFAVCLTLGLAVPAAAQSAQEYTIKASFITKFLDFVRWPDSAESRPDMASDTGKFVVAVLGSDPFHDDLKAAFQNLAVEGRPVVVRTATGIEDLAECKVVFISSAERKRVESVVRWAAENKALTIGDGEGFGASGVIINFYRQDEKVRFEINAKAAERTGFQISSLLLKASRIVGE